MNKGTEFRLSESARHNRKKVVELLDEAEKQVEALRYEACSVERKRDKLEKVLTTIKSNIGFNTEFSEGEKGDIRLITDRLLMRARTVNVSVTLPRNELQTKALVAANKYVDDLLKRSFASKEYAMQVLQSYINACTSEHNGPFDGKLQEIILECTADDQKKIRRRLEDIMECHSR